MFSLLRASRLPLALPLLAIALPAFGQSGPAPTPSVERRVQAAEDPWLYKGSDLPRDGDWRFGRLSNGLRYAVRKSGAPSGQVSIRVRIDAGSLMEADAERGFANLVAYLSSRGSLHAPDGESKGAWQRLDAAFDASTTFTQTVYKLDLPSANATGLDESFAILSGMMSGQTITPQALDAERPAALSRARAQPGARERLQDAVFGMMFVGQPVAHRAPVGTTAALDGVTVESVRAFHDRWYRPERAVMVVVGDVDTAALEAMIAKHFSGWKGAGRAPAIPDFGKPQAGGPLSTSIFEPTIPTMAMLTVTRPWTLFSDTVIFNQERMVESVALRVINRRLEARAKSGAGYRAAGISVDDVARSANVTTMQVLPVRNDWGTALKEARAVIVDLQANPPTPAEVDREVAEVDSMLKNAVATWPAEPAASLADGLVGAVDINETTLSAEGSSAIFRDAVAKKMFSPAAVQASARRVLAGTATRVLVNLHFPDREVEAKAAAALGASGE